MKGVYVTIVLMLLVTQGIRAQECEDELDKKTQKVISTVLNHKTSMKERFDLLNKAVEDNEDCLECKLLLGELSFERAERSTSVSYSRAQRLFEELSAQCPDFHANAHYSLGVIYYSQQEWSKCADSFKTFLDFPTDDPKKVSRSHATKVKDVEDILTEVEFNVELFDNPIDFNPQRIEGVSASLNEYLPMLSPDNNKMFYTPVVKKEGRGILDGAEVEEFTMSERPSIDAQFNKGMKLPSPFNVGDNYGGATLSVNNREMFITVCKPVSELKNLGPNVNSDEWESQPSLSADGNTLFFATLRSSSVMLEDGSRNSIDIYSSKRDENGHWGVAKSLGPVINTPGDEKSPFMHGDSRTLYFSAKGLAGVGGYDIYFSKLDDKGRWSKPKNIGVPINTPEDEHGLIVATDGSLAYYASANIRGAQGLDIYGFELPERARPEKVLLVKGTVKDESGETVTDARIELNYLESKKVQRLKVDESDGTYATIINVEREPVVMTIESEEHAFEAELFTPEEAKIGLISERDVKLSVVKVDTPYAINDINYATNSSELNKNSKSVLKVFAQYLIRHPDMRIAIHGHTDNVGVPDENLTLSTERAFEVMKYLQENGVSADVMTFKGFGQTTPVADNGSESGRAQNRRTEFVITAK